MGEDSVCFACVERGEREGGGPSNEKAYHVAVRDITMDAVASIAGFAMRRGMLIGRGGFCETETSNTAP